MASSEGILKRALGDGLIAAVIAWIVWRVIALPLGRTVGRLAFRWRRFLTPIWAALAIWGLAALLHVAAPMSYWVPLVLPVFGVFVAITGPHLNRHVRPLVMAVIPPELDTGRLGVLDRPQERLFFGGLCTWTGLYLSYRIAVGPSDTARVMLLAGLAVFGGSWYYHRRIRQIGRAERYVRKWPSIAASTSNVRALHGSRVVRAESHGHVCKVLVKLRDGYIADQLGTTTKSIASHFHIRPGSVFIEEDMHHAHRVWIKFISRDPWAEKLTHPLPEHHSVSLSSMAGVLQLGLMDDGTPAMWKAEHLVMVGKSGSGKSVLMETMLTWITACTDAVAIGIDMASGATLGLWSDSFAVPVADDARSALDLLQRVMAFIEYRERLLTENKRTNDDADDSFAPSEAHPWVFLIVDEFPDLVAMAKGDLKEIATLIDRIPKRARKAGVRMIFCAQNGSKADLGSKEMQSQMVGTIGLRLESHASNVLWGPALTRVGWSSAGLRVGMFIQHDPQNDVPRPRKAFFVPVSDRKKAVRAECAQRTRLAPDEMAVLMGSPMVPTNETVETARVDDPVWVELGQARHPLTAIELGELARVSRTTVYRRLNEWGEQGLVIREGSRFTRADVVIPRQIAG